MFTCLQVTLHECQAGEKSDIKICVFGDEASNIIQMIQLLFGGDSFADFYGSLSRYTPKFTFSSFFQYSYFVNILSLVVEMPQMR